MADVKPYKATPRRAETLSYLQQPLSADRLREQIAYILRQGWAPAIDHIEADRAFAHYWYMWKLPFFGEQSIDRVLAEIEECRRANPGHLVKLIGFDDYAQSQGTALIVNFE